MRKYNKKANAIIYNVLIIMISVAFISILGVLVFDIIKKADLSPEVSCYNMKISGQLQIQRACFNETTNSLQVSVRRDTSDFNVDSLDFSLIMNGNYSVWNCGGVCSTCQVLDNGELKNYIFDVSNFEFLDAGRNVISLSSYGCEVSNKQIVRC